MGSQQSQTMFDPGPGPALQVAVGLCVYGDMGQLRRHELHLGRLCAEGNVAVLDGALVHRPHDPELTVRFRSLQNLPRTAALPEALWANACDWLSAVASPAGSAGPSTVSVLVADFRETSDLVRTLVILARPIAAGEGALIALLETRAVFDPGALLCDMHVLHTTSTLPAEEQS